MSALAPAARIGPNAITRVAQALQVLLGAAAARRVFERAQLAHYLAVPPSSMVDEAEVRRLHQALRAECDAATVRCVARLAGKHTGDYLLAHRIPRAAQVVLRALPSRLATRVLLAAIGRHAWTFAGGGIFTAQPGRPLRLRRGGTSVRLLRGHFRAAAHAAGRPPHPGRRSALRSRRRRSLRVRGALVRRRRRCGRPGRPRLPIRSPRD